MDTKALIAARLAGAPSNPTPNVPAIGAAARQANPLLISERSETFLGVSREDASIIAGSAGNYYNERGNGNRVIDLEAIVTRNAVGALSSTSPAGQGEISGQAY